MAESKWNDEYYVRCYQLALDGMEDKTIAATLPVNHLTFMKWKKKYPALRKALREAREVLHERNNGSALNYIYDRLPPEIQDVWDKIADWDDEPNGLARIEKIMESQGKHVRQHLFVHAFIQKHFNITLACKAVCVPRKTVAHWMQYDPDFMALLDELRESKKDFYESALVRLVKAGDSGATIFANRTMNKDRGYADKISLEVSGVIQHNHFVVDVSKLDLPLEVRTTMLDAVRAHRKALPGNVGVIADAL